jgi:hypothetical protein
MPTASDPCRLEIEVHWNERPIRGRVHDAVGRVDRPFSGWLGLIAALEAAREADTAAARNGDSERCR